MLLCGLIIQVGNLLKLNDDSLLSKYEGWSDTEGRSDSKVFKTHARQQVVHSESFGVVHFTSTNNGCHASVPGKIHREALRLEEYGPMC